MAFLPDLTAGNLVSLRGDSSTPPFYRGATYISVCPNTNVYTARINQSTFADSLAQLTYDTGSGTLANVLPGMVVLISETNDRTAAYFRGRVRKTPGAATLYINETHGSQFDDDDYIFILDDFPIFDKLGVYDTVNDVLYPDWEVAFRELPPVIYNLQGAYADFTDASDVYEISFAPLAIAGTSGNSIASWAWDEGDGTITVGNSSTQNITVEFPAGFRWVHLTVTDDGGLTATRHIPVWAHDPDSTTNLLLNVGDIEVTTTLEMGPSANIPTFDGISSILDSTLLCAWVDEKYNGASEHLVNNIAFTGRLRTESSITRYDALGQEDAETRFVVEGPLQQLARIQAASIEIVNDATPTAFCEVNDLTPWRAIVLLLAEFSTFLELHSLSFDSADGTYEYEGETTNRDNLLIAVNQIGTGINAALQMSLDGQAEVVRHGAMLEDAADRNALTTVADWDTQDLIDLNYEHDHAPIVGYVEGAGGSKPASGDVLVADSAAHISPGSASGSKRLAGQVITAGVSQSALETELNKRTGHALAKEQTPDSLTLTQPDGYWFLVPSGNLWHTFTFDGSESVRGVVLTTATRWLLQSVTVTHRIAEGIREVEAVYHKETSGAAGETVSYEDEWDFSLPDFNIPFPELPVLQLPGIGGYSLYEGTKNIGVFAHDGYVYRTGQFGRVGGPQDWDRVQLPISTDDYISFEVDPASPKYLGTGNKVNAWVLTRQGIWYITDIGEADGSITADGGGRQVTFAVASSAHCMHVKRSTQGYVVAAGYYANHGTYPGVHVYVSTDGGATFNRYQVSAHYDTDYNDGNYGPGVFWSYKTDKIYTLAYINTNSWPDLDLWEASSPWSSFSQSANFTPYIGAMGNTFRSKIFPDHLHFPADESLSLDNYFFFTRWAQSNDTPYLYRYNYGNTGDDIHMIDGGAKGTRPDVNAGRVHRGRWNIHSYPLNADYMIAVLRQEANTSHLLYRSSNAGDSWYQWLGNFSGWRSAGISGNNPDVAYLTGYNKVGLISNLFSATPPTVQDMTGSLATTFGIGVSVNVSFDFLVGL